MKTLHALILVTLLLVPGCKKETKVEEPAAPATTEEGKGLNISAGGTSIKFGPGGLKVKTNTGEEVNVGQGGVKVKTGSGENVTVDQDGVKVKTGTGENVNVKAGGVEVDTATGKVKVNE